MEFYSVIKKNEIMPFVATRMNLEILHLRKSNTNIDHSYVESKSFKNDTNELIYKTDLQVLTTNLWSPRGKYRGVDKSGSGD